MAGAGVTSVQHQETCARCGHRAGGCDRCGTTDQFLGGSRADQRYCHTFSSGRPTCYELASIGLPSYGEVVATSICGRTGPDGETLPATIVVERGDDIIGITQQLFDELTLVDGLLVLDTAGHYRYRPVQTDLLPYGGRVVVCHRVHGKQEAT